MQSMLLDLSNLIFLERGSRRYGWGGGHWIARGNGRLHGLRRGVYNAIARTAIVSEERSLMVINHQTLMVINYQTIPICSTV